MPMRSYIARQFVTLVFLFVPAVGINTSCGARLAPAPDFVNLDLMIRLFGQDGTDSCLSC